MDHINDPITRLIVTRLRMCMDRLDTCRVQKAKDRDLIPQAFCSHCKNKVKTVEQFFL